MTRQDAAKQAFEIALRHGLSEAYATQKTSIANTGNGREPEETFIISIGGYPDESVIVFSAESFESCLAEVEEKITRTATAKVAQLRAQLARLEGMARAN